MGFDWLRSRRAGWVAATLAVVATVTATDATAGVRFDSRLDAIVAHGVLTVCSTGDYKPFSFRDANGNWRGVDVDMAGELAKQLGVKLRFHQSTWASIGTDVGGRCDVGMGGVSITLARARTAFYTQPYLRDGKTPITVRYPDNTTIFDSLLAGRADLMITDASETRYQAEQHPGVLCAVHPDQPFTFAQKAYLTPRGDVVFQQWVDQWLNIAMNDGTFQRLSAGAMG